MYATATTNSVISVYDILTNHRANADFDNLIEAAKKFVAGTAYGIRRQRILDTSTTSIKPLDILKRLYISEDDPGEPSVSYIMGFNDKVSELWEAFL